MITINFNIAADAALDERSKTSFSLPSPANFSGNKEEHSSEVPPAPQPTDSGLSKRANGSALPTPTDIDVGEASSTPQPGTPQPGTPQPGTPQPDDHTSDAATLPQPTTGGAASQEAASVGVPTPNDTTSLADEVNEAIGKAPKKSSRSKTTRSRSTTKKK